MTVVDRGVVPAFRHTTDINFRQAVNAVARTEGERVLRQAELLFGLNRESIDFVLPRFEYIIVPPGELIFAEGEPGTHLYVILDGVVKLGRTARDGRVRLVAVLVEHQHFGELSLLDPGPRTVHASTKADTALAQLSGADLRQWVTAQPEVGPLLLRIMSRRLRRTSALVSDTVFLDLPARLARQLMYFARDAGSLRSGGVVHVPYSLNQAEVAQLLGSSRETVNKALSEFAKRGWIRLDSHAFDILEPRRLAVRGVLSRTSPNHS
jgi:CRP-like cAMP-binding protein